MLDDFFDFLLSVFVFAVFTIVIVIFCTLSFDGYQSFKSEPAVTACRMKQMDSRRYTFTDSVVCVPFPTRQDTITVR